MKISEHEIRSNINDIYLTMLFYYPNQTRSALVNTLCQVLAIKEEDIKSTVSAACVLAGMELMDNGYVKLEYTHPVYPQIALLSLTDKGMDYYQNNEHPFEELFLLN